MSKQRRNRLPTHYDPHRRLLAAVLLQAVRDAYLPNQRTPKRHHASAKVFLADREGQALAVYLGISPRKPQHGQPPAPGTGGGLRRSTKPEAKAPR